MATSHDDAPLGLRASSPGPDVVPTPAIGASGDMARCLSTASSMSHGSATTDASHARESLGSDSSGFSRHSSASFAAAGSSATSRRDPSHRLSAMSTMSTMSVDRPVKRRGYMRPQPTDFAASARSRESVLSLGSIAHLQYYFARTGLLDGKGGQLARKRQQKAQTLDLSQLDTSSFLGAKSMGSDVDSSYASMGSSPDLVAHGFGGSNGLVESPIQEEQPDDEWYVDDFEEPDPNMLPPTASTYNYREKPLPKPPSIEELKADLRSALDAASKAVESTKHAATPPDSPVTPAIQTTDGQNNKPLGTTWYEVQGMHILDVMTLAIRAAKMYYTSHEHPDRLDAIKPEKEVRAELLSVMDVLKRMATRLFGGGMRPDEVRTMESWIAGLYDMLRREEELEAAEKAERASWTWLHDDQWPAGTGRDHEREYAFILSMFAEEGPAPAPSTTTSTTSTGGATTTAAAASAAATPAADELPPPWTPLDRDRYAGPTPFLRYMQSGVRLVQLHNAAVRKSRRRFGAIPSYHTDTQKPYRCAENLRYWVKAAELRWEVLLRVDALGVGTLAAAAEEGRRASSRSSPAPAAGGSHDDNDPATAAAAAATAHAALYAEFEDAILKWCRRVREEIAGDVRD
ncbi:uncharacterized protein E0L32_011657 [Thyridium curvatum]|uniref:Uncharacterized protein n=1 Tax=Thyridium curvatum TaxID=1093900 RepID=A0A507B816_9PEZI|nr:uncharacterized protein E0L32_011657 [Thyridium curvatum]TPX18472.1 hypothetical protein E0L32_011657 [Thyridium curvatum]